MDIVKTKNKLLMFRAKYGITQHEFAKMCKLSHTTVNKLENEKPVAEITLAKVNSFIDNYRS